MYKLKYICKFVRGSVVSVGLGNNFCVVGYVAAVGTHFAGQCAARGMLVRVAGDIIMMSPPLIITPEQIDFVSAQTFTLNLDGQF